MASNEAPKASNIQVEMNVAVPSTPKAKRNDLATSRRTTVSCYMLYLNTFRIKVSFVAQPTSEVKR